MGAPESITQTIVRILECNFDASPILCARTAEEIISLIVRLEDEQMQALRDIPSQPAVVVRT